MRKKQPTGSYPVGYCRPPEHTRFKPGQSGNPRGRPKGSRSIQTILRRVLDQKVTVTTEDGITRKITKIEAALTQVLNSAARGDLRVWQTILKLLLLLPSDDDQDRPKVTFVIED